MKFIILKLIAWFILIFPGSVFLHEYGHALAAKLYGVDSQINYLVGSSAGVCYFSSAVPDSVYFAGGLISGFILILVYFIFRKHFSPPLNLALCCIGASQIYYGILEGLNFDYGLYYPGLICIGLSLILMMVYLTITNLFTGYKFNNLV